MPLDDRDALASFEQDPDEAFTARLAWIDASEYDQEWKINQRELAIRNQETRDSVGAKPGRLTTAGPQPEWPTYSDIKHW